MTSNNLKFINLTKRLYGNKMVGKALDAATHDIKFNRIKFGKTTNSREFMKIFYASLKICLGVYGNEKVV